MHIEAVFSVHCTSSLWCIYTLDLFTLFFLFKVRFLDLSSELRKEDIDTELN